MKSRTLGKWYRVTTGAGMGLNYAGEVADLVLYWIMERNMQSPLVMYYARFKDDIITFLRHDAENRQHVKWLTALIRKARPYVLKLEKLSSNQLQMLDVTVNIHRGTHHTSFSVQPYRTRTSARILLGTDSAHDPSIHLSWPIAELKRTRSQCSDVKTYESHKHSFGEDFINNGEPPSFLKYLNTAQHAPAAKAKARCRTCWFVTSFSPLLHNRLKAILRQANRDNLLLRMAFGDAVAPPIIKLASSAHDLSVSRYLMRATSV